MENHDPTSNEYAEQNMALLKLLGMGGEDEVEDRRARIMESFGFGGLAGGSHIREAIR